MLRSVGVLQDAISISLANQELVTRYLNDSEFQKVLFKWMAKRIWEEVRDEEGGANGDT